MLEELEIRNLGPISHALFTPSHSMTAITGETGWESGIVENSSKC